MKQKHANAYRLDARTALTSIGISVGQDFHTLSATQIDGLLQLADIRRYQKPRNANGSRARYFHARLQRLATREVAT